MDYLSVDHTDGSSRSATARAVDSRNSAKNTSVEEGDASELIHEIC